MGSILVGDEVSIYKARRVRKLMGGALRQAGVVAATAIYALENNVERLAEDHANARVLAKGLGEIDGISLDLDGVQTNLVFFRVDPEIGDSAQLSAALRERGVQIGAMGPHVLRACTHLDVDRDGVLKAIDAVRDCLASGISQFTAAPFGPFARA